MTLTSRDKYSINGIQGGQISRIMGYDANNALIGELHRKCSIILSCVYSAFANSRL
jgi:hypothetical protein